MTSACLLGCLQGFLEMLHAAVKGCLHRNQRELGVSTTAEAATTEWSMMASHGKSCGWGSPVGMPIIFVQRSQGWVEILKLCQRQTLCHVKDMELLLIISSSSSRSRFPRYYYILSMNFLDLLWSPPRSWSSPKPLLLLPAPARVNMGVLTAMVHVSAMPVGPSWPNQKTQETLTFVKIKIEFHGKDICRLSDGSAT